MMSQEVISGPKSLEPTKISSLEHLLTSVLDSPDNHGKTCAVDTSSDQILTYGDLKSSVSKLSSFIISTNVERVGLCIDTSIDSVVCVASLIHAGIPYVPLDPSLPYERIESIREDASLKIIITNQPSLLNLHSSQQETNWHLLSDILSSSSEEISEDSLERKEPSKIYCIIYTSGSTATPKGVQITHENVINRIFWQWITYPFDTNEVCACRTPLGFVDSIAEILAPLLKSVRIAVIPKHVLMDPVVLIKTLTKYQITRITLVPGLLNLLMMGIKASENVSLSLKYITTSGEELKYTLAHDFLSAIRESCPSFKSLLNIYGSSEVTADVSCQSFGTTGDLEKYSYDGRVSIGNPIINTTLMVMIGDEETRIGELIVSGAPVTMGYLNTPVGLIGKFTDGKKVGLDEDVRVFRTGDRVKFIQGDDPFLVYYGRWDSMVKIDGNRIDMTEIESILIRKCGTQRPVVLFTGSKIVCFMHQEDIEKVDQSVLHQFIPLYALPEFFRIDHFPYLKTSGKVDRRRLIDMYHDQTNQNVDMGNFEMFGEETAKKLTALKKVLNEINIRFHPSSEDELKQLNFFKMGGTSLNAVLTISKLRIDFSYNISISDFLSAGSMADIIQRMSYDQMSHGDEGDDDTYEIMRASDEHKERAIELLAKSFTESETLLFFVHGDVEDRKQKCLSEVIHIFSVFYKFCMNGTSCVVVEKKSGKMVAAALNYDDVDGATVDLSPAGLELTGSILALLEKIELPVVTRLKEENPHVRILHQFVMSVDSNLVTSPSDRINLMLMMERSIIREATDLKYDYIVSSNTNPLTQDLATEVLGYDVHSTINNLQERKDVTSPEVLAFPSLPKDPSKRVIKVCVKNLKKF